MSGRPERKRSGEGGLPVVEVRDGRWVFVADLLHRRQACTCSICERSGLPGWALWEPDVECVARRRHRRWVW